MPEPDKHYVTVRIAVWKDNKLFMQKEWSEKRQEFYWDMPGGRIDIGETIHEGLHREVMEEIGVEIKNVSKHPVFLYTTTWGEHGVVAMIFTADFISDHFRFDTSEVQEVQEVAYLSKEEHAATNPYIHKAFIQQYFDEYLAS